MRHSRASLFVILLTALPLEAQTSTDKTASVEGIVTNSVTGAPVARAGVALHAGGEDKPATQYGTTTGSDGRFSITGLPPDSYWVSGDRVGFAEAWYTDKRTRITLEAGDRKTGIEIKLAPTGTIAGRVTDGDGEPVDGATVGADCTRGRVKTDEKGRYRIGGVPPGKCRVNAAWRTGPFGAPPEIRTDGTAEVHLASTYYPGVLTRGDAGLVQVRPASETTGIDIQLLRVPFVRVSGRIVGLPHAAGAQLLVWEGTGSTEMHLRTGGPFELWRLDPGKYTLSAEWSTPDGRDVHTSRAEIEVAGSNIENIELRVVDDSTISVRLEFEDDEAKESVPKEPGMVFLSSPDTGEDFETTVSSDGTFRLDKVPPAKYRVGVSWDTAYVKSMRLGTTPIEGAILNLNNGAGGAELSVLLSAATGSISGSVHVDNGGAAGATVVITGAEPNSGFEPRTVDVGEDGAYSFSNLAPGRYKLVAVTEDEVSFDDNSVFGYEDQMEIVEVGAKEKVTKDLKVRKPSDP